MNVSRETFGASHFFDLSNLWFSSLFQNVEYPWELLAPHRKEKWITDALKPNLETLKREGNLVTMTSRVAVGDGEATIEAGAFLVGNDIELRDGVKIEGGAYVAGPTILGEGTLVRHGAYIRGGVLTGKNVVIGHTSEVKSSIFLNEAKAAHFAYVGDSILGNRVNLGAGTKVSNLKITHDEIIVRIEKEQIKSGLRKFGAIIGDETETGCNSVLNPGVLLGKRCLVYPVTSVRNQYYKMGSVVR